MQVLQSPLPSSLSSEYGSSFMSSTYLVNIFRSHSWCYCHYFSILSHVCNPDRACCVPSMQIWNVPTLFQSFSFMTFHYDAPLLTILHLLYLDLLVRKCSILFPGYLFCCICFSCMSVVDFLLCVIIVVVWWPLSDVCLLSLVFCLFSVSHTC